MYPVDLFLLTKTKPLNNEEFNKYIKSISKSKREQIRAKATNIVNAMVAHIKIFLAFSILKTPTLYAIIII